MAFSVSYPFVYLVVASLLFIPISCLPKIALVPGAWHSPVHYTELITYLKLAGYQTFSRRNPSVAATDPNVQTAALDAEAIRDHVLMPLINRGEDVVLVMHSYGGLPGATAGRGLSKVERSRAGRPGGIVGLIFICALVGKEGQSLLSSLPGQRFDDWVIQYPDGQLFVDDPARVFYNDVQAAIAGLAVSELRNESRTALSTPGGPPAWEEIVYEGRRSYAHTLMDHSIPLVAQNAFLAQSGVAWRTQNFDTSHSPFLSQPKALSNWMIGEMASFVKHEMNDTAATA